MNTHGDVRIAATGVELAFHADGVDHPVLTGVDLDVAAGEVVAVAGRSGSGKTTFLTLVAGLEDPDAGTVEVLGIPAAAPHPWSDVALLPQSLGLLDELTVEENVALPCRLSGEDPALDLGHLLERLGLSRLVRRFPSEISLGEQQRTALARVMVLSPRLAVLDEPTGHQDDDHVAQVVAALEAAAHAGSAVLVATHDQRVWEVADRVVRLDEGRVLA